MQCTFICSHANNTSVLLLPTRRDGRRTGCSLPSSELIHTFPVPLLRPAGKQSRRLWTFVLLFFNATLKCKSWTLINFSSLPIIAVNLYTRFLWSNDSVDQRIVETHRAVFSHRFHFPGKAKQQRLIRVGYDRILPRHPQRIVSNEKTIYPVVRSADVVGVSTDFPSWAPFQRASYHIAVRGPMFFRCST